VALAQLGFPNAVATLGTACTSDHVQKLFRFTDSVVFSFDGDGAGRRAARKALDGALPYASDVRSVKFLFLPSEHDPDSYIREHGREAFARMVAEAVPLSRFLLDAAREGCELGSAEGRARMASNARPLWSALPDGALKRQLLGVIADQVQLGQHELGEVWGLTPPARTPRDGVRSGGQGGSRSGGTQHTGGTYRTDRSSPRPSGVRGRKLPAGRSDHAVRLLLADSALWNELSSEDHGMLCELPAPHGPLFIWLEGQLHEQGPLPWGALAETLGDQEFGSWVRQLMSRPQEQGEATPAESSQELRDLLRRMLVDRIKLQETEAIEAARTDPQALLRYRELQTRRRELEALHGSEPQS
jgi:DNA primase